MRTYEVVFDPNNDKGVYALSCVENPAMEDLWVKLEDHPKEIQFSAIDEEKRLLLGAALIPNKKIYRNINGEEFNIVFGEETIEQAAHHFLKNGFQNNSSVDHEVQLEGVSVVQSWIVDDPQNDKSNSYGKTYEKGTWVTMMKVDNDEAWQLAKEGKLNGFSIDGLFSLKELNFKKEDMSKEDKSLLETIRELVSLKKSDVKMGRIKLADGKGEIEFEGDNYEVGKPVFGLSEDKSERFPVPEGEHPLENGETLYVDKNGLVAEAPVEEPKEQEPQESKEAEEAMVEMAKALKALQTELSEMKKDFEAKLKVEEDKNKALEAKLEKEPAEPKIVKTELKVAEPKNAKQRLLNVALEALNN